MCVVNLKSVNKLDVTWSQSFLIFSKPSSTEALPPSPSAPPMPIQNQPQISRAVQATNNQATKSNASIPIHINIS